MSEDTEEDVGKSSSLDSVSIFCSSTAVSFVQTLVKLVSPAVLL
jgi:hypothetical protein